MRLRLFTILSILTVALALGACGNKDTSGEQGNDNASGASGLDPATAGEEAVPEGGYATIGGLKYQVQQSRELNPRDPDDRANLIGLAGNSTDPPPKETWFGVWMRVQNDAEAGRPLPTARDFVMEDTQGTQWRPIPLGPDNVFAYRPLPLGPTEVLPGGATPAGESTIQGALLLFRVPFENLQNRPLVLRVTNPQDTRRESRMGLDV